MVVVNNNVVVYPMLVFNIVTIYFFPILIVYGHIVFSFYLFNNRDYLLSKTTTMKLSLLYSLTFPIILQLVSLNKYG